MLLLAACGGRSATSTLPTTPDAAREVDGLTIFEMSRPTGELLVATLIFDVGSRQSSPPALATLSAWSRETTSVQARAGLDTTELRTECPASTPEECIRALVDALTRESSGEEHAQLRARLRQAQQADLGTPSRRVESLSLAAAWGRDLHPLAQTDEDADLSQSAVREHIDDHFGRARALLRLEGNLSGEPDPAPLASALSDSTQSRPPLTPPNAETRSLRVETGGADALGLAFRFRDAERARAFAEALAHEGRRPRLFRVRGAAIVLTSIQVEGEMGEAHVQTARHLLGHSRRRERRSWLPDAMDTWLAEPAEGPALQVGIGGVCAERTERDIEACQALLAPLVGQDGIEFEGDADENVAQGRFAGGGTLFVRRQPGQVGVAVVWDGGAAQDSPDEHGAHALAAISIARACGATPHVSAHFFGVTKTLAPGDAQGVEETLACATSAINAGTWSEARGVAHAIAAGNPERRWLADAISPAAPGWVVAEGSVHGLAEAQHGPWLALARARQRLRVAIVGDVGVEATVESASAAAARLTPGDAAPEAVRPGTAAEHATNLVPAEHSGELSRVVIAWQAGGAATGTQAAASEYASQAASAFRRAGLRVRWSEGGGDRSASWAAVALELSDEEVEGLPALVERSLRRVQDHADSSGERDGLDARVMALRAARTGVLEISPASPAVASELRSATPLFIVGREQQADAFRRHTR
ncbi:MAG: hypothetical protein AB8H86_15230 [Polyangiales bacterium]